MLEPLTLFDTYADAKKLRKSERKVARQIVADAVVGSQSVPKPLSLSFSSVSIEGFGSFAQHTEYPLSGRGLVLLQGNCSSRPQVADASNGTGKTTLAMAALWALTGSTDVRANGKPVALRGVINDRASVATVRLRGSVLVASSATRETSLSRAEAEKMKVLMLLSIYHHLLSVIYDDHGTDKVVCICEFVKVPELKSELVRRGLQIRTKMKKCELVQILLDDCLGDEAEASPKPMSFEVVRTISKRDHKLRFSLGDDVYEGTLAQVQQQMETTLRASVLGAVVFYGQHLGGGLLDKTDATLKSELQSLLPLSVWAAALKTAKQRLGTSRENFAQMSGESQMLRQQLADVANKIHMIEADAAAWLSKQSARLAERQSALGLLRVGQHRKELLKAQADFEREIARSEAARSRLLVIAQGDDQRTIATLSEKNEALLVERAAAERVAQAETAVAVARSEQLNTCEIAAALVSAKESMGWSKERRHQARAKVASSQAVTESDLREAVNKATALRATAMAAQQMVDASLTPLDDNGCCAGCGQPVSAEHLAKRHKELAKIAELTTANADAAEERKQYMQVLFDAHQLTAFENQLKDLRNQEASAKRALELALQNRICASASLTVAQDSIRAVDKAEADAAVLARNFRLQVQKEASDAVNAAEICRKKIVELEKHVALEELEMKHIEADIANITAEPNPNDLRLSDAHSQQDKLITRQAMLRDCLAASSVEQGLLDTAIQHCGPHGVPTLLYRLALAQLESSAARYLDLLSRSQLTLHLNFDEELKSIEKHVSVRRSDGTIALRSISQLSGGEWRRVALALSLAYGEFAKHRSGVHVNMFVFDEVLQHMDTDGQAAMAELLMSLHADTKIVIAHGLASESLYGMFDSIDVVEKESDVSIVRLGVM